MKYLLDTNILLRLVELNHPHHKEASEALKTLRRQNNTFYVLQKISDNFQESTTSVKC